MTADRPMQIGTSGEAESILLRARRIEESDPVMSEMLVREVRLFALKTNNPVLRVRAQYQLSILLINSTRYADALKGIMQVKELTEKLGNAHELGGYYEILGKIQISTGDYSESLKSLYLALNYFDEAKDPTGRGNVLNAIGVVFFRQGELDKALDYYTRAAAISILHKDSVLMGRVWNNLGGVLLTRGCIPQAMAKFRESLNLQLQSGMNLKLGIILMNLGNLYRQTGQMDQSIESLMKALTLFEQYDNYLHQAICCINISVYYESTGDDVKWLEYLRRASRIGDHYGFKGVQLDAADGLQHYFEKHGAFDSAYRYSVLKADVKQRIDSEKSASRLSVAEIQYQFDKKNAEQEIRQQRGAIEMARFRLRKHLGLTDPQINLVTFLGKI
jgi:tetratricopeptide (TPR) repeat protein